MTPGHAAPLRIALISYDYLSPQRSPGERYVRELAHALLNAGHRVHVLSTHRKQRRRTVEDGIPVIRVSSLPEALLRQRGFVGPLTQVPVSVAALVAGGFDVVHAFSTPDALTARIWRRLVGRPAVFTCVEELRRDRLADRRLRLSLLQRAVEDTDAVIAATEDSRKSLWRWLAVAAPVMGAHDVGGHERLYRDLVAVRSQAHSAG